MGVKNSYFPDEEYYFGSDCDNLQTFVEMLKRRGCYIGKDWHIRGARGGLKSKLLRNGYWITVAQYNKKNYYFMEHRVIWVWHNGAIPEGLVINHKDYNRGNNNIDNLELMTQKENTEYSRCNYNPCRGDKSPRATFTNKEASAIKYLGVVMGWHAKKIQEMIGGATQNSFRRVVTGERYPDIVTPNEIFDVYPTIVNMTRNKGIDELEELKNYILGLNGEVGELTDLIKKILYHGKEYEPVDVMLELGDILYYLTAICNILDIDVSEILMNNNAKLLSRYGDGYSIEKSINRIEDDSERKSSGTIVTHTDH